MHALETPQEVQVWYVIPALRGQMAREMLQLGMRQKEIASRLNITESAVSQYLKNKRAKRVRFTDSGKNEIRSAVHRIISEKSDFNSEVQRLIQFMLQDATMCTICRSHTGRPESCKVCLNERRV